MQHIYLVFLFIVGVALSRPDAWITAQPVAQTATSVRITVEGAHAATWPSVAIGGMPIPAQLVVVGIAHNIPAPPIISTLDCRPWAGHLRPNPRPIPEVGGQATTIPSEPIAVLRDGQSRGQLIRVLAVAAIIEREGQLCQITRLAATIPGAWVIDDATPASVTEEAPTSPPAANPAASRQALTVQVREAGMQRISGAALAHLGASRMPFDPAMLQLHRDGQEVALQLLGGEDGRIEANDELRFYAPDPGDRWNEVDTYWLTYQHQPGRRIEAQASTPSTAPQRTIGTEAGRWQPRTIYDSTLPGPDDDHWFADELRSGSDQEAERITIPLTPTLPLAAGPVTLTLSGSAYTAGPHQLAITAGSVTASASWAGTGTWTETITLDTEATSAEIALLPRTVPEVS